MSAPLRFVNVTVEGNVYVATPNGAIRTVELTRAERWSVVRDLLLALKREES